MKISNRVWKIIMWLTLIGALICFSVIGLHLWNVARAEKEYERLLAQMEVEEDQESEEQAQITPEYEEYTLEEIQSAEFTGIIEVDIPEPVIPEGVLQEAEDHPIDFDRLHEINPELYAWIRIPNTMIDYPIAQHQGNDQTFYLHRDMYKEPRFSGCIYTENKNRMDFTDPVTVLYGHNMKNGSMFQNLFYFQKETFFEQNRFIYIYTKENLLVYEIFAAYPYDNRHILNSFDFSDDKVLEEYLKECQHPRSMEALVREDVVVTKDTPIITLSTCIARQTEQRFLVQAVLIYEESR